MVHRVLSLKLAKSLFERKWFVWSQSKSEATGIIIESMEKLLMVSINIFIALLSPRLSTPDDQKHSSEGHIQTCSKWFLVTWLWSLWRDKLSLQSQAHAVDLGGG